MNVKISGSFLLCFLCLTPAAGQFMDQFQGDSLRRDPRGLLGWTYFSGDGSARMDFGATGHGHAAIEVDATHDKRNIWWALIRRCVSGHMDLNLLANETYALRIESRIRVSHAPRRVNLHLNTQRTTNFHSFLMEFDIPDTTQWHTISMTARGFDAVPGDTIYGQLALMDWGPGQYRVNLDYFRVDIVRVDTAGPDKGVQVAYHPPLPDPATLAYHLPVAQDAMIDREYPSMSFATWSVQERAARINVLTVSASQYAVLRWDFTAFRGKTAAGPAVLDLTTYACQRDPRFSRDFGMIRISEITGGDTTWSRETVTFDSFCNGDPFSHAVNPQMIVDVNVAEQKGEKTLAVISRPVMQRLLEGRSRGLAILPLGAIQASLYATGNRGAAPSAVLHLNLVPRRPSDP